MRYGFSVYLDALRVIVALNVFLCHVFSFKKLVAVTPAWAWWSHESVIVFFVLSGLVIAHASAHKDATVNAFAISRLTRIYSVVIPAIFLTFLADRIGMQVDPAFYAAHTAQSAPALRATISLLFLNESWLLTTKLFSNQPFWSIPYEIFYYALFASWFYFRGTKRWILLAVFAAIAGPKILLLGPIWLMGIYVYRETRSAGWSPLVHWLMFVAPLVFYAFYVDVRLSTQWGRITEALVGHYIYRDVLTSARYVMSDTALGLAVAMHLLGAKNIFSQARSHRQKLENGVRTLSGYTFSLYLLHLPLVFMFTALLRPDPGKPIAPWLVILPTLIVIMIVSRVTEQQRHRLKPAVAQIWHTWVSPPARKILRALAGPQSGEVIAK